MTIKNNNKGILWRTTTYAIGHMQYVTNGRNWREYVKNELSLREITVLDPYNKPFIHDVPEDENARKLLLEWMEAGAFDEVAERMWLVRGFDLRSCDLSDFIIAHIDPMIASWGTAEELVTSIRQKKVIFLSVEGGKKKCPLWLMGSIPHKYIYDSIEESVAMIKDIDDGKVEIDSERWKLLKYEFR